MSGILDAVRSFLTQDVTLEPYVGRDAYGTPTYGAAVTVKARVAGRARRITTAAGDDTVSMLQVYFGTSTPPGIRDRITLPTPYVPRQPPILAVMLSPDEQGELVCEVFC